MTVNEERDDKMCEIIHLRKAIMEEFDAANTYTKFYDPLKAVMSAGTILDCRYKYVTLSRKGV